MIPDFMFEYIALNPIKTTIIMVSFYGFLSIAAWVGFLLEENKDAD